MSATAFFTKLCRAFIFCGVYGVFEEVPDDRWAAKERLCHAGLDQWRAGDGHKGPRQEKSAWLAWQFGLGAASITRRQAGVLGQHPALDRFASDHGL